MRRMENMKITNLVFCLFVFLSGCAVGNLETIANSKQLERIIARSPKPVLVDYYKGGCPTCVLQEAVLEGITDEYVGKVRFVKFKIREATMARTDPDFMTRNNLMWVPTTILYVRGLEFKRWTFNARAGQIRPVLDKVISQNRLLIPSDPRFLESFDILKRPPDSVDIKCIPGQGCSIDQ